jgi:hypothetical protein
MRILGLRSDLLPATRNGRLERLPMARRIGELLIAPLRFSVVTGHGRSSLRQESVDSHGEPIPWITYPAYDLLASAMLANRRVLEFGAGCSTLWWAARGARISSLEADPAWHRWVANALGELGDVRLVEPSLEEFPDDLARERYDVIVVDGLRRQTAARIASTLVRPGGCVIQDNSEGLWSDTPGRYEIVELFAAAGFQRVDFYGFAPACVRRQCTSIYFRDRCFLFDSERPPRCLDP